MKNPDDKSTAEAPPGVRTGPGPAADEPSMLEACSVLGVLLIGLVSCWLLYGSLIVAMLRSMLHWGRR